MKTKVDVSSIDNFKPFKVELLFERKEEAKSFLDFMIIAMRNCGCDDYLYERTLLRAIEYVLDGNYGGAQNSLRLIYGELKR